MFFIAENGFNRLYFTLSPPKISKFVELERNFSGYPSGFYFDENSSFRKVLVA